MSEARDFRGRKRPGWLRPSAVDEVVPIKRLKGLEEFETPAFVGRMARVERRRKRTWYAMLAAAVALGAGIGLVAF